MAEKGYPKKTNQPEIFHYKTDYILGEGGTGIVYRGLDPKTGEVYAIKLFRANFFRNKLHKRDLEKMVKKCRKFDHPNVVKIKELLTSEEMDALVLE